MDLLKSFRNEFKYRIKYSEMVKVKGKLREILKIDRNDAGYMVRSLYFDSVNDIDYFDNLDGVQVKKKIRLRIYDTKGDVVKLEYKWKSDIHQIKESLLVDKETALELIKGNYSVLLNYDNDVAKKIYVTMVSNCYIPKQIVEYKRIAFISNSTTRVTFDYEIKQSKNVNDFFNDNINYGNVVSDNEAILEVKFDGRLESYISDILKDSLTLHQSSSKYVMSRDVY